MAHTWSRRDLLMAGGRFAGVLAATGLDGVVVLAQGQGSDLRQATADAAWKAFGACEYRQAVQGFTNLRRNGRLLEWEYYALCHSLVEVGRGRDALSMAQESVQVHRNADSAAVLALTCYETGDLAKGIKILRAASEMPGADATKGPYSDALKRLSTRRIVLTHRIYHKELCDDGQRIFRELGHYVLFQPRKDPWQQAELVRLQGATRREEWTDHNENRVLKVWPTNDDPIVATFEVVRKPWITQIDRAEPAYVVPEPLRCYLGTTLECDPTTARVRSASMPLRGATRAETVRNVHRWWWPHNKGIVNNRREIADYPGQTTSEVLLRQIERDGFTNGTCGDEATVACALLRCLGIAATHVFSHFVEPDPPRIVNGHEWPVYFEPEAGWVSLLNGRVPVGEFPGNAVSMFIGEGMRGKQIMGSHLENLGQFWWSCSCSPDPKNVSYGVSAVDVRLT